MTLSAWRPLKDAPKNLPAYVETSNGAHIAQWDGEWAYWPGEYPCALYDDTPSLPIADTLELDRAVQSEIARAFGELLGGLKVASHHARLASQAHSWPRFAREQSATDHRRNAVSNFRRILHTSMGGRIPDEVP